MSKTDLTYFLGGLSVVANVVFGEWSPILTCFLILMLADIIIGIVDAIVFHKTKYGNGFSSNGLYIGAIRKCLMLIMVIVGKQMDIVLGLDFIRSSVITYLAVLELVSVVENLAKVGVPIPEFLKKILNEQKDEVLK